MLRVNQNVPAVFYLPHIVAAGVSNPTGASIEVRTTRHGQQWPALSSGEADITVGGVMRTLRLRQEGNLLINFCACVGRSPLVLLQRGERSFEWRDLWEGSVIDDGEIETGNLCLQWLASTRGVSPGAIDILVPAHRSQGRDWFVHGVGQFLLQPFEDVADLVLGGQATIAFSLAEAIGDVPWSTYSTLPSTLRDRRGEVGVFAKAISEALRTIERSSPRALARIVSEAFPQHTVGRLAEIVDWYKRHRIWPTTPIIAEEHFTHFQQILLSAGWLDTPSRYGDQVDQSVLT